MKDLREQYMDCCDRLYLNNLALKETPYSKTLKELIEKDEALKKQLEKEMDM